MRVAIHITTGSRQYGHSCSRSEQGPQTHWWPQGPATWVLGRVKQTMHVVSPPKVDSGTAARPVSNLASASESAVAGCSSLGGESPADSAGGACSSAARLASSSSLALWSSAAASSASSPAASADSSGSRDGPAPPPPPLPFFFFFFPPCLALPGALLLLRLFPLEYNWNLEEAPPSRVGEA